MDVLLDLECDVSPGTFAPARTRIIWWSLGRWMVVMGLLMMVLGLDLRALGLSADVWGVVLWVGFGTLFISVLLTVIARFTRTRSSLNTGHFHFIARQDGLTVEGPFGTQTVRWSAYRAAYRDKRFIYLMLSKRMSQVIPLVLVQDPRPLLDHLKSLGLL